MRRAYASHALPPARPPTPRPARPPLQHVAETRYRDSSGPSVRNRLPGGWGGDGESPAHAPRFPYRLGIHGTVWGFRLKYLIQELVGSGPPRQKGSWWGLHNSLCFEFTQKWNELCFVNTPMLTLYSRQAARRGSRGWVPPALLISLMQIAHKSDACVLFDMPSMCTWYMVHGMRYEVRGIWYVVQGTECMVQGTRYKVQNTCMIMEEIDNNGSIL